LENSRRRGSIGAEDYEHMKGELFRAQLGDAAIDGYDECVGEAVHERKNDFEDEELAQQQSVDHVRSLHCTDKEQTSESAKDTVRDTRSRKTRMKYLQRFCAWT